MQHILECNKSRVPVLGWRLAPEDTASTHSCLGANLTAAGSAVRTEPEKLFSVVRLQVRKHSGS